MIDQRKFYKYGKEEIVMGDDKQSELENTGFKPIRRISRGETYEKIRDRINDGRSLDDRVKDVKNALNKGFLYLGAIAKEVGLCEHYVCKLMSDVGINIIEYRNSVREKLLKDALGCGESSLERLCEIGKFRTSFGLRRYCEKRGIELPLGLIPYKQRPEIDVLIEKGESLVEIGEKVKLTGERIRQYINESGQHKIWKEKRNASFIEGEKAKEELKSWLNKRVLQRRKQLYICIQLWGIIQINYYILCCINYLRIMKML